MNLLIHGPILKNIFPQWLNQHDYMYNKKGAVQILWSYINYVMMLLCRSQRLIGHFIVLLRIYFTKHWWETFSYWLRYITVYVELFNNFMKYIHFRCSLDHGLYRNLPVNGNANVIYPSTSILIVDTHLSYSAPVKLYATHILCIL